MEEIRMHLKEVRIVHEKFPTTEYYPFNLEMLYQTNALSLHSPVSFFVGENGTGKSTLLKAITLCCGINIWQGERRIRYDISPYEEMLFHALKVEWTNSKVPGSYFDSQIFRNFALILDEWAVNDPDVLEYFGGKSLVQQSHGQSLMSFFKSRFKIKGLYLLDEPETALSPKSQLALLTLLKEMARAGHAQFIIATHSPILLACPGSAIFSFDHIPIRQIAYEDTEYYRIYKSFMNNRTQYL
jgi:predicted ATPase